MLKSEEPHKTLLIVAASPRVAAALYSCLAAYSVVLLLLSKISSWKTVKKKSSSVSWWQPSPLASPGRRPTTMHHRRTSPSKACATTSRTAPGLATCAPVVATTSRRGTSVGSPISLFLSHPYHVRHNTRIHIRPALVQLHARRVASHRGLLSEGEEDLKGEEVYRRQVLERVEEEKVY